MTQVSAGKGRMAAPRVARSRVTCAVCGRRRAKARHVTRTYDKGAALLVIEDIPAVSCADCGETYFTTATLHEIERIKLHRRALARRRPVAVAAFVDRPAPGL